MKRLSLFLVLWLCAINIMAQSAVTHLHNGHEYVDLGLPSGTLWATCNVGATIPEGYGDHFAWGEVTPKNTHFWSEYTHCNGSYATLTKYNTMRIRGIIDYRRFLEAIDDAATQNWGGEWRMPTKEELQELRKKCKWKWTTVNGVNGYRITGKNGNSIFLPAAGLYFDSEAFAQPGKVGGYWSSSLWMESPFANGIQFKRSSKKKTAYQRIIRQSVRPVCSKGITPDAPITPTIMAEPTKPAIAEKPIIDNHEYVDLGLSSGTLWATCNVGATIPEGYGDYFAWGETTTKGDYDWSTYQHGKAYNALTKYCPQMAYGASGYTDSKRTLDAADDAATMQWGDAWRTPTAAELQELREQCTWEWTAKNEVNGYKITGKNGNTIFLPAAGYRYNAELNGAGKYGYYLSSSSHELYPNHAQYTYFRAEKQEGNHISRYYGQTIRPVRASNTLAEEKPETADDAPAQDPKDRTLDFNRVRFASYIQAGAVSPFDTWGYVADLSMGIRIKKYVYLGVEVGFTQVMNPLHYTYNTGAHTYDFYSDFWCIPAGLNLKVYFPGKNCISKRIYPYVNIMGGVYYGTPYYTAADNTAPTFSDANPLNTEFDGDWQTSSFGVYAQAGLGIDFSWFTMGMGYTLIQGDIIGNMAYMKIGVRLGKY